VPASLLGASQKERGPAFDGASILKHSQSQTVREPGDMWSKPAESAASNSANPLSMCLSALLNQDHRACAQTVLTDPGIPASTPRREEGAAQFPAKRGDGRQRQHQDTGRARSPL